jgi:short-subunit dehydrogenase
MKKRVYWLAGLLGVAAGARYAFRRPLIPLQGRVVIVTGASSGIGRATAHACAAQGAAVILAARRAERLAAVQDELAAYDAPTLAVPTDLRSESDLHNLVDETLDVFGRIDVLVNDAAADLGGLLIDNDPARVRTLVDVNFHGTLRLTQLVVPVMLRQRHGHLVFVSSSAASVPVPAQAAYTASKAALAAFTSSLRREVDDAGLRVTLVQPALVRTPMIAGADEVVLRGLGAPIQTPEEAAAAIVDALRFGARDVVLGGLPVRAGMWVERFAPRLVDRYWHWVMTPEMIEAISRFGEAPDASTAE